MEDDLLVISRFKNALLYDAIMQIYPSVTEFCRVHGISATRLGTIINLKISPKTIAGEWKPVSLKLADILGFSTEELFPDSLYRLELPKSIQRTYKSVEVLSLQEAAQLRLPSADMGVDEEIFRAQEGKVITEALTTLTPQEEQVLRMRFGLDGQGEHTLQEVGDKFGRNRERIRSIEVKALRKLRHPNRARKLHPLLGVVTNFEEDRRKKELEGNIIQAIDFIAGEAAAKVKHGTGRVELSSSELGEYAYLVPSIFNNFEGSLSLDPKMFVRNLKREHDWTFIRRIGVTEYGCENDKCVMKRILRRLWRR